MNFLSRFLSPRAANRNNSLSTQPPTAGAKRWGDLLLPQKEATAGFLAVGAPGSGKSIMLRLLMQSAFKRIGQGFDERAIVYDAKLDALQVLSSACKAELRTTNPFDIRGCRWAIHEDVIEPRIAVNVAFTLFPESHDSTPFFADAVRHIAASTMTSFTLSGYEWTLGDLMYTLKKEERIKAALRRHPQTREVFDLYFSEHDKRLSANILSTCASKCLRYDPVAAAWDHAKQTFAIKDWLKESYILILGSSEESRIPIDCINRAIFKRASDLILNQSESFDRRDWVFIDELAEAPKLDGLVSLLKKGRSKGACVAIAFQSISGLHDQDLYGQHFADELLGQIGNRFFGRIECLETAEWASRLFGDQEYEGTSTSVTNGPGGVSHSTSKQIQTRRLVMPGELMSTSTCSRENGLCGFNLVRSVGAYKMEIDGDELFDELLVPVATEVPEFIPRPAADQFFQPWPAKKKRELYGSRGKSNSRKKKLKQTHEIVQKPDLDMPSDRPLMPEIDDIDDLLS